MARTKEGAALTEVQRRRQLGLRAATIRDIIRLWPMWDLDDPSSYDRFVDAVIVLTQSRARDSAVLAARYYEMFKDVEIAPGVKMTWGRAAVLTEPATPAQIRASINATAKAGVFRALGAGFSREAALNQGLLQVSGSMGRHVLNGGRNTIMESARQDAMCLGWARVTDAEPCAFCAMLASRGPAYKEETVHFQAHDHCTCGAEPVYAGSKWPGRGQEFKDLWNQTKKGHGSKSAIAAFREAYANTYLSP